ncbi:MAG: TRAP transporter permease [Rhodobacteraceae bacterium]|nr:TRAP transporter permease [Paracoccaceae bacterium]
MACADPVAIGGFVALFAMLLLRVPIGVALGLVGEGGGGRGGFAAICGWEPALKLLATSPIRVLTDFHLSLVVFVMLMGSFATHSGMRREMFRAANAWFGALRGGVAMSTIAACGGLAAICGSSVATAATMTRVALPEMRKPGYRDDTATGVIAAGGAADPALPGRAPAHLGQRVHGAVFVIGTIARDVSRIRVFRGVLPFIATDLIRLVLFLPSTM